MRELTSEYFGVLRSAALDFTSYLIFMYSFVTNMVSRTGPIPLAPPLKKRAMLLSTRATTSTAIM
jgi:hypothetical protein